MVELFRADLVPSYQQIVDLAELVGDGALGAAQRRLVARLVLQEIPTPEIELEIARQDVADLKRQEEVITVKLDIAQTQVERLAEALGVRPWDQENRP